MGAPKGFRPPRAGIGRPKGIPNKTTTAIKEMVVQALSDAGGVEYLARQAEENPSAFLGLVGKVLPLQVSGPDNGPIMIVTGVARAADIEGE